MRSARFAISASFLGWGATSLAAQVSVEEVLHVESVHTNYCDWFGHDIELDRDLLLVGGSGRDTCSEKGMGPGTATVYRRDVDAWGQERWILEKELSAGDGEDTDQLGYSVSIAGGVLFAGAPTHDDGDRADTGAVYIFHHNGLDWFQSQKLTSPRRARREERFGASVDADGDRLLVGARGANGAVSQSGAAHVYRFDGSQYVLEQTLIASDGASHDHFGSRVSLQGDLALVAAYVADAGGTDSGAVYAYRLQAGVWNEVQKLTAPSPTGFEHFGTALALDAGRIWIGASGAGTASLFEESGGVFQLRAELTSPEPTPAFFGRALDAVGERVVVSGTTHAKGSFTGTVNQFRWDGVAWVAEYSYTTSYEAFQGNIIPEFYGYSIAVQGDRSYVGAPAADNPLGQSKGIVFVYEGLAGHANEDAYSAGDEFRFRTTGGLPGGPALFFLVGVNGSPTFQLLLGGSFRNSGRWKVTASVPPGLAGNALSFLAIGQTPSGRVSAANVETVRFE